ncbi:Cysteine desulfurase, mitochondrial, partial [Cucurbita argyrosperma subsp. argyrosperma]
MSLPPSPASGLSPMSEPHEDETGISMKGVKISGRPLYLDMQATSPADPRVLDARLPYYLSRCGNPPLSDASLWLGIGSCRRVLLLTEHKCVLDSCRHLQQQVGFDITYLPVGSDGIVDLEKLRSVIRPDTGLVSVMAVNNEIGVIQPLEEIGKICKEFNVPFHTDAAQALGEIPIDLEKWNQLYASKMASAVLSPSTVTLWIKKTLAIPLLIVPLLD